MRVLLSTYGSRVCAPPDEEFAELAAAQFDTVAAAAEECDGPVATGVMPIGGWR